jgi:SecD/SecF fusion protein
VRKEFAKISSEEKVANPDTRFEVILPRVPAADANKPPFHLNLATDLEPDQADAALKQLATRLRDNPALLFERVENFGGAVAGETRTLALMAIVASWLIIIAYVWFRFKNLTYGMAAVLALVHDVLITLGAVALSPYKIDLPMIAAFLTLIGFSVNDTIVIFDRIREIKGKTPILTSEIVNAALNQTLSRTILTSLTAWIVVVIMYFLGGEGLQGFSFCLVVGFLSGTYSTIYIATPILVDWIGNANRGQGAKQPAMAARLQ